MKPTIRNKLIAGFSIVLFLMAVVAGIAGYAVVSLRQSAYEATRVGARLNSMALEIQVHALEAQRKVDGYLLQAKASGTERTRAASIDEARFETHAIQSLARRAIAIAPTTQLRSKFEAIQQSAAQYDENLDKSVEASKAGIDAQQAQVAEAAYKDAAETLHENAEDGEIAASDASQSSLEAIDRTSKRSVGLLLGISILALVLGMGVSYKLTRAILIPVEHLKEVAESLSLGNLHVAVRHYSDDEIGELADSFSRMVTAVKFFRSEAEDTQTKVEVRRGA